VGFLEIAERFKLAASSGIAWAIAADGLEDAGGCVLLASAMRAGIYTPAPMIGADGYGSGDGSGSGDGDG
jgi:hypothetical protein